MSKKLTTRPGATDVSAFLGKARAIQSVNRRQVRLVFALDATASREPTWALARQHHRALFDAADAAGNLALQLCYFRGFSEFSASPWITRSNELRAHMDAVTCQGGPTQITRLIQHFLALATPQTPVRGLVFIGDACEEPPATLYDLAGQCRLKQQPLFLFQEGQDARTAEVFEKLARLSGGAYAALDGHSAERLRSLLGAVARYAAGGRRALRQSDDESDKLLLSQLPPDQGR